MATVDPVYAQWLQDQALYQVSEDAALRARWGVSGITAERITTIALQADAQAEAARQLAFMGGPLVQDEHVLVGQWAAKLGQVITITGTKLGYEAGLDVFVIGVNDDRAKGTSTVTVLRRL